MCCISSFLEGFAMLLSGCKVEVFGRNLNMYPSKGYFFEGCLCGSGSKT
jgi:hypothetical protein